MLPSVRIPRNVKVPLCNFTNFFKGFEGVEAVRVLFGEETDEVLKDLKVEFFSSKRACMGVSDEDGHIMVSTHYLKHGDEKEIYLDVIHELVHVKQFREGRKLFDDSFEYTKRPTEIEAYGHVVQEARRLGMNDEEIFEYLQAPWMNDHETRQLAGILGVAYDKK